MKYKQLEKEIRNKYNGDSALDDWVIDCGNHIFTKIIAFNLFTDIHLMTLKEGDFLKIFFTIEEHLQKEAKEGTDDAINRIKGAIKPPIQEHWNSPETLLKGVKKLSIIKSIKYIKSEFEDYPGGNNFLKTIGALNEEEEEVDALLSKFITRIDNGESIPFNRGKGIVWCADTDEVKVSTRTSPASIEIRDLLGLYYYNEYLVEIQFNNEHNIESHKPTIFHSEFGHHWKPSFRNDGWGTTLNIRDFTDGVRESVIKEGNWPKSSIKKLGVCSKGIREDGWDEYFERRVNEFRAWRDAKANADIISDLEYFLNKWRE